MFPTSTNKATVASSTTKGSAVLAFPNVCHTPAASGTPPQGVAAPYPNVFRGTQASTSTKVTTTGGPALTKGSAFGTSQGSVGGVVTNKVKGKTEYLHYTFANNVGAPTAVVVTGSNLAPTTVMMGSNVAPTLRNQLNLLHAQLGSLPGNDPNRWHQILDEYVLVAAELYKALAVSRP